MREVLCFIDSVIHDEVYCALDSASFERRTYELAEQTNGIQRIGEQALHQLAGKSAACLRSIIEKPYHSAGLTVLGAGFRSTIYTSAEEANVYKLHRGSVRMNVIEQEELNSEYTSRQKTVEYFLGKYALHQDFSIQPHPFKKERKAVIGRQPLVHFDPLPSSAQSIAPETRIQLNEFISRSEELLYSTGYLVDVKGTNNLVLNKENGKLVLIDTIPCDPTIAPERVIDGSLRRLDELKRVANT